MIPAGRIRWLRTWVPLFLLSFLSLSCGIGGTDFAGGGTGGTGISTGAVSGFGSVVVNGVHYNTNAKTKKISNGEDNSAMIDQDLFRVGMVVTVRYSPGNNDAQEIEFRNNLQGPISSISSWDNTFEILGLTVVVDNGALFATLNRNDVVEVSGFVDNAGRVRAGYVSRASRPVDEFEVKGFISGLSGNTFRLGLLPDGSGATVAVSYGAAVVSGLPEGPVNGIYVQVNTTDREPVGGVITATRIVKLAARTDFPVNVAVDLEGLVTAAPSGSGNVLSFAVEGKAVRTNDATVFLGGKGTDIQPNVRVQVRGTEAGGVLSAVNIIFR